MSFTPHGANQRRDVDRCGPGCGEFPKGERAQPDNACGAQLLLLLLLTCAASIAGCAVTRTGGEYLSIPAPTKPHAPGAVEMPPKAAEAEYR
jgi:hypothetical protein